MISFLFFIGKTFFICLHEYVKYLFSNNYKQFVQNIAKNLARENILYVKIFQSISCSMNDEINKELIHFTDNAPYCENDIDYEVLKKIMYEKNLMGDIKTPANSGMISIVFKMKSAVDDSQFILKLKRNNIEKKLKESINNLSILLKIISFFPISLFNAFDMNKTIQKNIDVVYKQLDFQQEVKNMKIMKDNCKHISYVVIPRVYEEITEKYNNIIMMEFIEGNTLLQVDPEDYNVYSKLITKFGFACLLNSGFSHGDLHAGNILFIKNDTPPFHKLGIIDFGIMIQISQNFKNDMLNIATNLFDSNPKESAIKFISIMLQPIEMIKFLKAEQYDDIVDMFTKFINDFVLTSKNVNQMKFYLLLNEFNQYLTKNDLKKYGLSLNENFVNLQVAVAMCHGVTMHLSNDKYVDIANEALNEMFHSDFFENK